MTRVGCGAVCWLPSVGDAVEAHVSVPHRRGCSAHHTATHILAAALRAVLPSGTSLVQVRGKRLVVPGRLI
jgi:alanyl-tRNA synthetase